MKGPRTWSSPKASPSQGNSSPDAASAIRASTSATGRPWEEHRSASSDSGLEASDDLMVQTEPIGLVSVIPQACRIGKPVFSRKPSDRDFGTAEPPQGIARRLDTSWPSRAPSTPIQMVGTPAATVTLCLAMSSTSGSGVMLGPGNTNEEPANTPEKGSPQALT